MNSATLTLKMIWRQPSETNLRAKYLVGLKCDGIAILWLNLLSHNRRFT